MRVRVQNSSSLPRQHTNQSAFDRQEADSTHTKTSLRFIIEFFFGARSGFRIGAGRRPRLCVYIYSAQFARILGRDGHVCVCFNDMRRSLTARSSGLKKKSPRGSYRFTELHTLARRQ